MIELNKAGEIHARVADLLRNEQLLNALEKMKTLMEEAADWNLRSEYENMHTTYHQMLHFIAQGMEDPEREKIYHTLITKGLILNDRLLRAIHIQQGTYHYYKTIRDTSRHPHLRTIHEAVEWAKAQTDGMDREATPDYERIQIPLFNTLWTSDIWSPNDREAAYGMITSIPHNLAALCVSAVTLGLMEMYDPQKYLFLLDAYKHPSNQVNQRAVAGVILGCLMHDNRMRSNAEIRLRVELMTENAAFCQDLQQTQMHLLSCRETEKISKFMNEEFIPEMLKNPILKKDKTGLDSLVTEDNLNPEWEKWMESKDVKSKMHIMSELYSTGADIHMASFANMKNFPFFRETANWFIPFDRCHPALAPEIAQPDNPESALIRTMIEGGEFCDSDCYSLYLFLSSLPHNSRQTINKHMPNLPEEVKERIEEMHIMHNTREKLSKKYVQNIYRFYKLFARRHEFTDIFEEEVNLQFCDTLQPLVHTSAHIKEIAMFLFAQKRYEEADMMYSTLEVMDVPTLEISQKRGFCMQQLKQYDEAITHYENADLMQPDNLWNLTHLAQCYNYTDQQEKAAHYYLRAEKISPEDLNLQLQTGNCLAKLGHYEEAFKRFFKVHFLNEKSATVWRAIAWYSLLAGKTEQAEKFYKMIEEQDAQMTEIDLLNIGHMHWIGHRYDKAVAYYHRCVEMAGMETFRDMLLGDADSLMLMHMPPMDIPIILDLMKEAVSY